jgi:hypothetical protein
VPVAGLVLAGCAISTTAAPTPDAIGRPALDQLIALSVVACEPVTWCVAAGTNPTSSVVGSASIEISAGGHHGWGHVAGPPLADATLTAASCWASGCLLGGSDAAGSLLEIVNPKKRVASIESATLPGSGVAALSCPASGRCLALVTTSTATAVFESTTSGATWQQLSTLPVALSSATALSCPTRRLCVAVGTGPTGAEAARSTDGGRVWSLAARPKGLETFSSVSCGPSWCMATARQRNGTSELLQSRNRGKSWGHYATTIKRPVAVACVTAARCVVVGGTVSGAIESVTRPGVERALTVEYVPDPMVSVACASATRCAGITELSTVSISL